MNQVFSTPLFGLVLTVLMYYVGVSIQGRWNSALLNPILVASVLIGAVLMGFRIPYAAYQTGGSVISFFLGPLTVALALPLYRQRELIRRHFLALTTGIMASILVSAVTAVLFTRLFGFDKVLLLSLLPKSLTNPIAAALSAVIGGNPPLTVAFVIIAGITGVLTAPLIFSWLKIEHPVARGTGLGAASHALGTARAFGFGETEGSVSSVSIGLTGLLTTLLMPLLLKIFL